MAFEGLTQYGAGGGLSQFAGGYNRNDAEADDRGVDQTFSNPLRSVTVAQLSQVQRNCASGATLVCDGKALKNITIVGVVESKQLMQNQLRMHVNDGSGVLSAVHTFQEEDTVAVEKVNSVMEGRYVRLHGVFSPPQDPHSHNLGEMVVFNLRPISDHNEVVYHNLDVIFQHMYLTKGSAPVQPQVAATGGYPTAGATGMGGTTGQCNEAVLALLRGGKPLGADEVTAMLQHTFPPHAIAESLSSLSSNGMLVQSVYNNNKYTLV